MPASSEFKVRRRAAKNNRRIEILISSARSSWLQTLHFQMTATFASQASTQNQHRHHICIAESVDRSRDSITPGCSHIDRMGCGGVLAIVLQAAMAQEVMSLLDLDGAERILDVGCGDGKIAAKMPIVTARVRSWASILHAT